MSQKVYTNLYNSTYPILKKHIKSKVFFDSDIELEEFVHECMTEVLISYPKYKPNKYCNISFLNWMKKICDNNVDDFFRKKYAKKKIVFEDINIYKDKILNPIKFNTDYIFFDDHLKNALMDLNYRLINLKYFHGMKHSEISKSENMNKHTVIKRLQESKKKLRRYFSENKIHY